MHIRRKAWTEPQLERCSYFVEAPGSHRGHWRELFARQQQPMELEIGCGKGVSTAAMAHARRDINFVAIDEVRHMLAVASKNADAAFAPETVDNLLLSAVDAMFIRDCFAPEDAFTRIHISFPNPWTDKRKHFKRRLTHPRQLIQYRDFLAPDGELLLKTDNASLFAASHEYLNFCGFYISFETDDLHASGYAPNYISEHEALFSAQGLPIHFLIARKCALPDNFSWCYDGCVLNSIDRKTQQR